MKEKDDGRSVSEGMRRDSFGDMIILRLLRNIYVE